MQVYSRGRNNSLYRNGLTIFLEYRLDAAYGAPDLIPSVIRNAVDRIMEITQETSSRARSELNKEVIAAVVRLWKNIHVEAIRVSKRIESFCSKDTDDARLLCLVAGMGIPELTQTVLKHCDGTWSSTYRLGSPMDVAVRAKDLRTVKAFLADTNSPEPTRAAIFSRAIDNLITSLMVGGAANSDIEFVKDLLHLHHALLGRPRNEYCYSWLFWAADRGDMGIVGNILDMGFTSNLATHYRGRLLNAWHQSFYRRTTKLFVTKKVFDMDKTYTFKDFWHIPIPTMKDESVLSYAVHRGHVDMVQLALKAGANANGAINSNGIREYPIRHAIMNPKCRSSILKSLLAHGAKLDGDDDFFKKHNLETIDIGPKKRKLLDAAMKRMNHG
jgi:hypothetical protein